LECIASTRRREQALEKDPADCYQTMRNQADLRRAVRSKPMDEIPARHQSRSLAWGLATAVGLAAGLAGYVAHAALANHTPTQEVRVQRLTDMVGLEESPALSPDGKTVAFVLVEAGGRRQIWVRLLAGGALLAITKDDTDHYGPRWSPDSSSLIYYTRGSGPGDPGTIWEIPALGGAARKIVSALGPGDFSHDGKSLAFFRLQNRATELAVAASDQSSTRVVAKLASTTLYSNLRWSPDDTELAFLQDGGGPSFYTNLMVIDASGGEPRNVAGGKVILQGFAWSPDRANLIVSSAKGSALSYPPIYNLWAIPHDGSSPSQLTFGESSYESPDVGPKGDLAVSRVHSRADVWKFPTTGDPAENALRGVRVTHQTGQVQTVTVKPDESEIAFLSDSGGHANVWIARTSDGEMRQLTRETDPRFAIGVPAWSPRGDLISFLSDRNSGKSSVTLWVAKPDGSELRDSGVGGAGVCWSDDGHWLYYSTQENGSYQIRKVPGEGGPSSNVREDDAIGCAISRATLYYAKILNPGSGVWDFEIRAAQPQNGPSRVVGRVSGERLPAFAPVAQPYVSPDGLWLALPMIDGATTNLWALPAGGGDWKKLTDFGARNVVIARRIAWSKDGKYIYAAVSDVDSDVVMLSGLKWR
jgi:Tol biopolymer transport system component